MRALCAVPSCKSAEAAAGVSLSARSLAESLSWPKPDSNRTGLTHSPLWSMSAFFSSCSLTVITTVAEGILACRQFSAQGLGE